MKAGTNLSIIVVISGLLTLYGSAQAATASFEPLGRLPCPVPWFIFPTGVHGVSADGSVAVGFSCEKAFRWTAETGMQPLTDGDSDARAVSADGTVVVGTRDYDIAFRWTPTGGMRSLPDTVVATDVSADGSVVVGRTENARGAVPFRWTASGGTRRLGFLPGGGWDTKATAVSADGSTVVGYGYSDAARRSLGFRWTTEEGMQPLGETTSFPYDVSYNGSVIVGQSEGAFLWTEETGMVSLGPGYARAVSADGRVIVVNNGGPFLWTAETGVRSLKDILQDDCGLDLTGWTLSFAVAISADGLTIVGSGINPDGEQEPWLATIEPPPTGSLKATNPKPPDGAEGVTTPLLQWTAGDTAKFHDVYFGTNPTPGPAELVAPRWILELYWVGAPPGLIPGTTYYWRIDEIEANGTTIHTGDIWSFTAAPFTAFNPDPPDGAESVDLDADPTWTPGLSAISHNVYFGTDPTHVADGTGGTFKGKQQDATYDPGTLAMGTTYYWRIDELDEDDTEYPGEVWSFTTILPTPIELEITGPDEVFEQSSAQYNATAHYADASTKDVTIEATWSLDPPGYANIDENGLLTTEEIDTPKVITIHAEYTEGGVTVHAEKAISCLPYIVPSNIYYVDAVYGHNDNDGLTPETAFATIQKGVNSAVDGDTIIVADGTYTGEGNRDINLKGKAITLQSTNGAANCIIDCMHHGRGLYLGHNEDSNTIVEGFTIVNGVADNGGGIYCSSSPTISHCVIRLNQAKHGAGLAIQNCGQPTIANCLIAENFCTGFGGGGIDCHNASPTIINSTIADNSTRGEAGAIACRGNSSPIVTNCILWADSPNEISLTGEASASVTYCDVQGGWPGEGNIDADPRFCEVADAIVSHWTFDEGAGDIAYDSADDNHGIVYGAQWTTGQVNGALDFDGYDDYVALADDSFDDLGSDVTFSAWVYRNETGSKHYTILGYGDSESDHWFFYLPIVDDVIAYALRRGSGSYDDCWYRGSRFIGEHEWYHVVVVTNGSGAAAYINGQPDTFTKQAISECPGVYGFPDIKANAETATIGILIRLSGTVHPFDGKIDELMIFNRALSAPEVQQLYQDSLGGPVAHWPFDEATGSTAYDSTGDNHGTIHGAQWTAGRIKAALDFDAADDYVEVAAPLDTDLETSYAVSAWINVPDILSTYGVIIAYRHQTNPSVVFQLDRAGPDIRFIVRDEAANIAAATYFEALTPNDWHHVTGVRDADNLHVYVNGLEGAPSSNQFGDMVPNDLKIGALECCGLGVHHHFNGAIDDVRIYDRALSVDEIQALARPAVGKNIVYRLSPSSPCIDAGDPNYIPHPNEKDLDGNLRVTGDAIDMGAFESQPLIEVPVDQFEFEAMAGSANPPDQVLILRNGGAATLNWQISSDCTWLHVDPDAGTSKGQLNTVWLRVHTASLTGGEYDCELTVSAPNVPNSPQTIRVTLRLHKSCFPDTPDYAQQYDDFMKYVAHGADPTCWCAPPYGSGYQCHGDADGITQGFLPMRVMTNDLAMLILNWKKKIDTADPCADFDHSADGFQKYRVLTNDLAILVANWKKRDPDLPRDCPRPDGM